MNVTRRALFGAAVGAVLTLLVHPVSRPFLLVVFWHPAAIDSPAPLPGTMRSPGLPQNLLDASVWMQAACERIVTKSIKRPEVETSLKVALLASKAEPENAYWKQMSAVFYSMLGQNQESNLEWSRASKCGTWNDLQTKRLEIMQSELVRRYGASQSWELVRLYPERSSMPAEIILEQARRRVEAAKLDSDSGRSERFDVLLNGDLIRSGAQSLAVAQMGANIVELACHPAAAAYGATPARLLTYRARYIEGLRKNGYPDRAKQATGVYRENDSWSEFVNEKDAVGNAERYSYLAIVLATAPSVLLALSVAGACFWVIGMLIPRHRSIQTALGYPAVFSLGLVLALGAYAVTLLPLAGLALGLCASFLAFSPKHERRNHPEILGPFFVFATGFLALSFAALFGLFLTLRTPPSVQVLTGMDLQGEATAGAPALVGLSLLVVGLLLLIAPFWAFAQRIRTASVLSLGLRSFGSMISVSCLAASILLCPLAVYADQKLNGTMTEIVTNEQLHYNLQR